MLPCCQITSYTELLKTAVPVCFDRLKQLNSSDENRPGPVSIFDCNSHSLEFLSGKHLLVPWKTCQAPSISISPDFITLYILTRPMLIILVDSVCLSVCLSDNFRSFESLNVESWYLYIRCVSRQYGSGLYMKVIGSRSRSQEPKTPKMPISAM